MFGQAKCMGELCEPKENIVKVSIKRIITYVSLIVMFITVLSSICYANTYSNNSIEISVSPVRRSYDYGDNVSIDIGITNKNRYAKIHYKITEIYSGGGFEALNLNNDERIIDELDSSEFNIELKDKYYKETENKNIDTHITFKNDYYNGKGKITIGENAYELTREEYEEFTRYRNEKIVGEKIGSTPYVKGEPFKLSKEKGEINATLLIIIIVLLVIVIFIIFIWFIIKSKSRGGYTNLSKFTFFMVIVSLILRISFSKQIYAADIYQENLKYNKTVSTQVGYANFTCTFDVKVEYYFVNNIAPITDLSLDTDSDTLPDYLEVLYLTDLNNEDTDGDTLPDGIEVYRTYTDPLRIDTNNNGVNDGDEDYDKDKLTNIEEKSHGTDYGNKDTDFDGLTDYEEINGVKSKDGMRTYILDPLSDDTDSDGLRDDTEIKLGLNPTNPNDANTKVIQEIDKSVLPKDLTIESSTPIRFYGELIGDIDENVKARVSNNNYYEQIDGLIGIPIIIDTTYDNNAGLKIAYDLKKYKNIVNRIAFCRIENGKMIFIEKTYVDNNILHADCYSGEYCLIDSKKYMQDLNLFLN